MIQFVHDESFKYQKPVISQNAVVSKSSSVLNQNYSYPQHWANCSSHLQIPLHRLSKWLRTEFIPYFKAFNRVNPNKICASAFLCNAGFMKPVKIVYYSYEGGGGKAVCPLWNGLLGSPGTYIQLLQEISRKNLSSQIIHHKGSTRTYTLVPLMHSSYKILN